MNKARLIERIQHLSAPLNPVPAGQSPRLKFLPSVHCVALDFYGTMFISGVGDIGIDEKQSGQNLELFRESLLDAGFHIEKKAAGEGLKTFENVIDEYQGTHKGKKIDYPEPDIVLIWFEVLKRLIKKKLIEGKLDREVARRFAVEYEFRFNAVWPMPGLIQTLQVLKERRFVLGIISNSQFYTSLSFEALTSHNLLSAGFDADLLVWSYRAGIKKPSLHFYERFIRALHRKHKMGPEQVLFAGNDMLKDIKPASELGMKTALFAGDKRSLKLRTGEPECRSVEPDIVITELKQLFDCLREGGKD